MLLSMVAATLPAHAQAAGASDAIWASGSDSSASNVSMTGTNGHLWFAIEFDDPGAPGSPALALMWYNLSGPSFSYKVLQSSGSLTNNAIYPSILTWSSTTNVLVAGKVDDNSWGLAPHLKIHTQDRTQFLLGSSAEDVTGSGLLEHAVPHLTRDRELPAQHLCWTAKNSSGTTEDVKTKVKDAGSWFSSTLRSTADSADTEDHCQIDFTYSGRRYTVYHRDTSDAAGTQPDIWLEITTWDGTTWTEVADFGLTDSDSLDFPSLWIHNTSTTAEVAVVAGNNGNVALWRCGPTTESSCDTAGDFGSPQAVVTGGSRRFPEVFIVPRSAATDTHILVEKDTNPPRVNILSFCGGTGSSPTAEAPLPMPNSYMNSASMSGIVQSWARSQVKWDGTEFHVAFLAESPSHAPNLDVLRYHAEPGDLCP